MTYEKIKTEYLEYLMNRVGLEKDGETGYLDICEKMQDIEFFPIIEMDENRCGDCVALRKDFEGYICEKYAGDILDGLLCDTGTFMELLVVMAEKMQYELSDSQYEASARKWFMEMLGNCGLDKYAENALYNGYEVERIAEAVIFREIGWDGEGGLFPLFMAQRDQRKAELVMQMNDYLEENYDIC